MRELGRHGYGSGVDKGMETLEASKGVGISRGEECCHVVGAFVKNGVEVEELVVRDLGGIHEGN